MVPNAHTVTNLQLRRDLEQNDDAEWYECHECGAEYRSRNARVMCCSHGTQGGDGE